MNVNEVIKYPILSEKSYQQMATGVYTFAVDFRTNKAEVKKVVEHIFDVKVAKVNIATVQKKPKKVGRFDGFTNRYKKAVVTLSEGVINIFPEEVEEKPKEKVTKKEKKKEISEAEKRAAEKIAAKEKEKLASKDVKKETKVDKTDVKAQVKKETKEEVKKTENK
ncbi:MAG: 50S ribosomal protein L23 [Proteobacteria bacterium]|nr:50S ribosomal protein L23 [Pseudomonadota bacterium]